MSELASKMSTGEEFLDIAKKVAGWAGDGEQVEACVMRSRSTQIRAYQGGVESLSQADTEGVGIRVVKGRREGFAYAGSLDPTVVEETLGEARDNAEFTTADEFVGLAEPDGVAPADLDLWSTELAELPVDRKVEMALELEARAKSIDPRIVAVPMASYSDGSVEAAIATSTGIAVSYRRAVGGVSVFVLASDGKDQQSGGGFSVGRLLADLDIDVAARDAGDRATRLLGATQPGSMRLTVVLDPMVTAQFLMVISPTLSGDAVLKGRSFFANRLGETVAAPSVTLVDDPTDPDAYGAAPFDGEGLATRRLPFIEGGVLQGFAHSSYSARRAGAKPTGSAVRGIKSLPMPGCTALALNPGTHDQAAIMREVGDGLLVQDVSGLHSGVDPVSGDFSVGATGVRFRNGEPAEPVREITIASTIQRMFQDIAFIGSDVTRLPMPATGLSLAIRDVSMSGA